MADVELTIIDHMNELRKRIIKILVANIIASVISYYYIEIIMKYILKLSKNLNFIYVSPPELFLEYVKVSVFIGIFIAMPLTLYQIWVFLKPGLKKRERRYLIFSLYMGVIFFALGAVFAYIVAIPMAIKFFTALSTESISAMFSINNYIRFVITLIVCFGIVFELPLIILLLTSLGLVTPKYLREKRKYAILIIFIIAAILTPPDVIAQLLMAGPMLLLYEISVILSYIVYKKKNK